MLYTQTLINRRNVVIKRHELLFRINLYLILIIAV